MAEHSSRPLLPVHFVRMGPHCPPGWSGALFGSAFALLGDFAEMVNFHWMACKHLSCASRSFSVNRSRAASISACKTTVATVCFGRGVHHLINIKLGSWEAVAQVHGEVICTRWLAGRC